MVDDMSNIMSKTYANLRRVEAGYLVASNRPIQLQQTDFLISEAEKELLLEQ